MKKKIALLLVCSLLLVGCGSKKDSKGENFEVEKGETITVTVKSVDEVEYDLEFKVLDTKKVDIDGNENYAVNLGIKNNSDKEYNIADDILVSFDTFDDENNILEYNSISTNISKITFASDEVAKEALTAKTIGSKETISGYLYFSENIDKISKFGIVMCPDITSEEKECNQFKFNLE